jgi:hypothetical protein
VTRKEEIIVKKMNVLLGGCLLLTLGAGGTSAFAAQPGHATCSGGEIAPGTYNGLTVTGDCTIKGEVTINGNVSVRAGAYLDAAYLGTRLTINGNVNVGNDARLGLGCTFGYHDCGFNPTWLGAVVVNGNIVASQPLTMYLDFVTIHGNVVSNGGGDITAVDPGGLVFPIKDNVIDGNIVVNGWEGAWFGVIRNTVGGNVSVIDTAGTRVDPATGAPDSTEIVTNTIAGNLICLRNAPPAQIGDSGGEANTVGGKKIGECAGV